MNRIVDILLTDLHHLIRNLGKDGGLIGPAIYDTAQVLRFAPPEEVWPALDWLLEQQQSDGGWGDPAVPRARDVPTLAAALALHRRSRRKDAHVGIQAALAFLHQQSAYWTGALSDDIPVGVELLLPRLLEDAEAVGLEIPTAPYAALIALGQRRQRLIAQVRPGMATSPVHSWEGWGNEPDPSLADQSGGIGHSPAATAAWLHMAHGRDDLADIRARAQNYLQQAAAATNTGIPGLVPTVWPIERYEQAFGLYMLLIAGLLDHPALQIVIQPQIDDLARAVTPAGLGMSDLFMVDGDNTAAALAVLGGAGRRVDVAIMERFLSEGRFFTYPGEFQPSISVAAHAIHAMSILGQECDQPKAHLVEQQRPDGRWVGDKWNGSWLYTTSQVIIALCQAKDTSAVRPAVEALLSYEHSSGGWGIHGSTIEETSYTVLALRALAGAGMLDDDAHAALVRAERWLLRQYRPFAQATYSGWVGKEMYRPLRLARLIEVVATMPLAAIENPSIAKV
jgi:hypothetical protein